MQLLQVMRLRVQTAANEDAALDEVSAEDLIEHIASGADPQVRRADWSLARLLLIGLEPNATDIRTLPPLLDYAPHGLPAVQLAEVAPAVAMIIEAVQGLTTSVGPPETNPELVDPPYRPSG